ncbi:hypothetical protein SDC9_103872 [bioreactor metagenome]|uniref:Uncharacterized protein n=1 Tax=bioreactor metagenome TaxID=1076179 RepID=A0A645B5P5_9ZZZZ
MAEPQRGYRDARGRGADEELMLIEIVNEAVERQYGDDGAHDDGSLRIN